MATKVERVAVADYKKVANCLYKSFIDDPVANYFVNTGVESHQKQLELILAIMECLARAHLLKGAVYKLGDYESVALWLPPGKTLDGFWTFIRSGMWKLQFQLSKEGRERFFGEFSPLLSAAKAEVMGDLNDKSWYLVFIATEPQHRGKGNGRVLIEHVTTETDRQGLDCYLESSNIKNLPLYEKTGFRLMKEIELTRAAEPVKLYPMRRTCKQ